MTFYLSIYFIIAFFGLVLTSGNKVLVRVGHSVTSFSEIYLASSILVLFLICGLRDVNVGVDTPTYVKSFQDVFYLNSTISGEVKFEIGYRLFVSLLRLFTDDEHIYIFAMSAVTFGGLYVFIKNNCKENYAVALLVFMALLYYTPFSAIRQSAAVAIGINSFSYLRKRKWVRGAVIILIGASFHTLGLVLLGMIPFSLTKWTHKKIIWAIVFSVVGTILFERVVNIVIRFFPIYARYWGGSMMEGSGSAIGVFAIFALIIIAFSIWSINAGMGQLLAQEKKEQLYLAIVGCIFAVAVNLLGKQYGIFSRVQRFFVPFVMMLCVEIYSELVRNKKLFYAFIAAFMGVYMFTILRGDIYHIIPYKFFF